MERWIAELEQNLDDINLQIVELKKIAASMQSFTLVTELRNQSGELMLAPLLLAKANTTHALIDAYIWQANNKPAEFVVPDTIRGTCSECGADIIYVEVLTPTGAEWRWQHKERTYQTGTHDAQS